MAVSEKALLQAIETGLFLMPELPGRLENIGVPRVMGRITPYSHPLANLVGAAAFSDSEAEARIRQVRERFTERNLAFGWVTGPGSTPLDLPDRLAAAGLVKAEGEGMAGMALTDLAAPIRSNPAVRVREATPDDQEAVTAVGAEGFGLPPDVSALFTDAYSAFPPDGSLGTVQAYLACWEGSVEPVAFAASIYLPGVPIVLLAGAATLPGHRGRGLYTRLVARRLADARARGMEAAVIQAVRATSAPICRKMGFTELCGLDFHLWMPEPPPA